MSRLRSSEILGLGKQAVHGTQDSAPHLQVRVCDSAGSNWYESSHHYRICVLICV